MVYTLVSNKNNDHGVATGMKSSTIRYVLPRKSAWMSTTHNTNFLYSTPTYKLTSIHTIFHARPMCSLFSTGIPFTHPRKHLLLYIKLSHILSYQILSPMEYHNTAVLAKFIQHFSAVPSFSNFLLYKTIHLKLRTCPSTILYTFSGVLILVGVT